MILRVAMLAVVVVAGVLVALRARSAERARLAVRSFDDALDELRAAFDGFARELGVAVAPSIRSLARAVAAFGEAATAATAAVARMAESLSDDEVPS
jgi:hypothetical protein